MTGNNIFLSIKKGLNEAIEYEKGTHNNVKTNKISIQQIPHYKHKQIKEIRNKLNLTQAVFAEILGVSVKTVEAWESGRNIPNGSAQRILDLLNKEGFLEKNKILKVG